jgi:hypothetical protein
LKKLFFILVTSFLTLTAFAHEGHDNAPGSFKSIHGGTVQTGKQLNLEVIINGMEVTIFPTSHEGKDIALKDVKVDALAKPKKGKPYPLSFSAAKNGLSATVDLKGANRLPIEISVTNQGKKDHFTVQVEE